MAIRKKKTENQKAFQKERRRLLQAVRRAEKQGYIFPEDIIPNIPKRVTKKALEKIQVTKPSALYKIAQYVYEETGELVPAEQRKQEVKQQGIAKAKATRKKKPKQSKITVPKEYFPTIFFLDNFKVRIDELQREEKPPVNISFRKNELLIIFEDTVALYEMNGNISEYADYLKEHESEIADLLNVISYDSNSENINASFASLGRLLNVTSLSMEQAENLSSMAEYYSE